MKPSGKESFIPTKTSVGIILCRKNSVTRRPEVLLVHKRYTYAFAEFVHGRYSRGPTRSIASAAAGASGASLVTELLDAMSREELLDVYSLNFSQMWYRIWLTHENVDLYHKKHARFQSAFMRYDGGAELRALCLGARSRGVLMWEVPKGRRLGPREPDIMCAVRELREETGVHKSEYRLIPGAVRHTNYISAGARYIGIYFIAICLPTSARLMAPDYISTLRDLPNLAEISEVRWHDCIQIRQVDTSPSRLMLLLSPVFNLIQNYCAGKWSLKASPVELPVAEKTAGTPAEKSAGTPVGTPAEAPTEAPVGTPAGTPAEKPAGTPTEAPVGTPTEKPTETPVGKPVGTPTETPTEAPVGTPTEAPAGKPIIKAAQSLLTRPGAQTYSVALVRSLKVETKSTETGSSAAQVTVSSSDQKMEQESMQSFKSEGSWSIVRGRRYARSLRGRKAASRARVLIDNCVPSSTEVITTSITEVVGSQKNRRPVRSMGGSWRPAR